jgi:hypothetical protein
MTTIVADTPDYPGVPDIAAEESGCRLHMNLNRRKSRAGQTAGTFSE